MTGSGASHRPKRSVAGLAAMLVLSPPGLPAQSTAPTIPARLEVEIPHPFTIVSGLTSLPDGRLVVTDRQERRIVLLDPATNDLTDVGRQGQGPREFIRPSAPTAMPDGTVLVYDSGNRRFLELGAEGRPVGTHAWPADPQRFGGRSPPRGADAEGRLYWLASLPYRGQLSTHAIVVQWRPGGPLEERVQIQSRDAQNRKILRQFVTRDGWAVAPSGDIGIVRGDAPAVEWHRADGTIVKGPPLDVRKVPIDDAELATVEETVAGGAVVSGGASADGGEPRPRSDWITPAYLPPFQTDHVHTSPRGKLWVPLRLPIDEPRTEIWVFDGRGRLERKVHVDERVELRRVGAGTFYATVPDDLGFQRLRRYAVGGPDV